MAVQRNQKEVHMALTARSMLLVVAHLCFVSIAFGQPTFLDVDFNAGWTHTILAKTPSTATLTVTAMTAGGSVTPPYRRVEHLNFSSIVVAHVHLPSTYDPATGSVATISYSYDLLGISLPTGQAVAYRLLLVQSGSHYAGPNDAISAATWTGFPTKTLTAASFTKVAGTGPNQPDFSCKGGRMTFGYVTANSSGSAGVNLTRTSGIDNWKVTVNKGAACCVAKIVCTCPSGSIANSTNQPGVTPDGKCKKEVCRPITGTPLPPNGTPIGSWGFTWGDAIWQYVEATCVVQMDPPGCCP
jgi:hypothetical protein